MLKTVVLLLLLLLMCIVHILSYITACVRGVLSISAFLAVYSYMVDMCVFSQAPHDEHTTIHKKLSHRINIYLYCSGLLFKSTEKLVFCNMFGHDHEWVRVANILRGA